MNYEWTGDPAGSRSLELDCREIRDLDGEGLWFVGYDEEGMEVEVEVKGLTLQRILGFVNRQ